MDIRNQQHTIFPTQAKAAAFVSSSLQDLCEGERYEISLNPKGESALVGLYDGDAFLGWV